MDPVYTQALERFEAQLEEAKARDDIIEPTAMTLATVGTDGHPNARIVLLKGLDPRGFVFYTNLESDKGKELAAHPHASLVFYWGPLAQQVRVRGRVEPVSDAEADAYFQSRARGSRLGAWASDQSRPLDEMGTLKARADEVEARYEGKEVPRPPHWSGFRLAPEQIEFWYGREFRLHERIVYALTEGGWESWRLFP